MYIYICRNELSMAQKTASYTSWVCAQSTVIATTLYRILNHKLQMTTENRQHVVAILSKR